jgi:hypothetical protein
MDTLLIDLSGEMLVVPGLHNHAPKIAVVHVYFVLKVQFDLINIGSGNLCNIRLTVLSWHIQFVDLHCGSLNLSSRKLIQVLNQLTKW